MSSNSGFMELLRSAKALLRYARVRPVLKKSTFDLADTIMIFSEARSGSTWLMECLERIPGTAVNWEPLHAEKGVGPRDWGWRPYLREEEVDSKVEQLLCDILTYRVHNAWTTSFTNAATVVKCRHVLTKFVRANLLLPHFLRLFDPDRRPILLLRHPVEVCASQRSRFDDGKSIRFEVPRCRNSDRYLEVKPYVDALGSDLEVRVATWCLHNCETLNALDNYRSRLIVVDYRRLMQDPHSGFRHILCSLGFADEASAIMADMDFARPSSSTRVTDASTVVGKRGSAVDRLTDEQRHAVQSVFDHFGFTLYNAWSPELNPDACLVETGPEHRKPRAVPTSESQVASASASASRFSDA